MQLINKRKILLPCMVLAILDGFDCWNLDIFQDILTRHTRNLRIYRKTWNCVSLIHLNAERVLFVSVKTNK